MRKILKSEYHLFGHRIACMVSVEDFTARFQLFLLHLRVFPRPELHPSWHIVFSCCLKRVLESRHHFFKFLIYFKLSPVRSVQILYPFKIAYSNSAGICKYIWNEKHLILSTTLSASGVVGPFAVSHTIFVRIFNAFFLLLRFLVLRV